MPLIVAEIVDLHDAGMVQGGGDLGLLYETLGYVVQGEARREDLKGLHAVELEIPNLVDGP